MLPLSWMTPLISHTAPMASASHTGTFCNAQNSSCGCVPTTSTAHMLPTFQTAEKTENNQQGLQHRPRKSMNEVFSSSCSSESDLLYCFNVRCKVSIKWSDSICHTCLRCLGAFEVWFMFVQEPEYVTCQALTITITFRLKSVASMVCKQMLM